MKKESVDLIFLVLLGLLVFIGLVIFYSASLGLNVRENITFSKIVFSQIFFGVVGGMILLWITSKIPLSFWRKHAFQIFIFCFLATFLVFVPMLGFEHNGARRWIGVGNFTLQPSELLKIGSIIIFSAWIASVKQKIQTFKYGLLPTMVLMALVTFPLLLQKDTGTTMVILGAIIGMYFLAGAKVKHALLLVLICIIGIVALYFAHDYVKDRINVFFHPDNDPQGKSYQIQQSLIAVGSGGLYGKGLGQSVQKFGFLPEPMGDSIFAVFSEEWGLIGGILLVILFVLLALRGLKIAVSANDKFGFSLVSGIMLVVILQSFINIGAMIGIVPLTGIPLVFVSKGGTSLLMALGSMGIVLGVSRGKEI